MKRRESSVRTFGDRSKMLKRALDNCFTNPAGHDCCVPDKETFQPLPGIKFRLIDTLRKCIVEGKAEETYAALSYVWGDTRQILLNDSTHRQLLMDGALDVGGLRPSQTILEAMALCQMIGQRYLWVDSLCIRQDNERDKRIQILRMRQVYRRAALTMVAACGTNAPVHTRRTIQ